MVNVVDLSNGSTVYVFPLIQSLKYTVATGCTPMAIPTFKIPYLMNFGGGQPTIDISFTITPGTLPVNNFSGTPQGDWYLLTWGIDWGGNITGFNLELPEVSTVGASSPFSVQVFASNVSVTYAEGTTNTYTGQANFMAGVVLG